MRRKIVDLLTQVFPLEQPVRITVRGGSMYPYILDGDLVEMITPHTLRKGDIIIFRLHDSLISHRIIAFVDDYVHVRGDASRNVEVIERSKILGKVVALYRNDRRISATGFRAKMYARFLPWSRLVYRLMKRLIR